MKAKISNISERTLLSIMVALIIASLIMIFFIYQPELVPQPPDSFVYDAEKLQAIKERTFRLAAMVDDEETGKRVPAKYGSAFMAFEDTIFVTCYHCIDLDWESLVLSGEDPFFSYIVNDVLAVDEKHDLALLRCGIGNRPEPLPVSTELPQRLDPVANVGSPGGVKNVVSTGAIRRASPYLITGTVLGKAGCSGSPVLTPSGEVIGVFANHYTYKNSIFKISNNGIVPIQYAIDLYNDWLLTSTKDPLETWSYEHTCTSERLVKDYKITHSYLDDLTSEDTPDAGRFVSVGYSCIWEVLVLNSPNEGSLMYYGVPYEIYSSFAEAQFSDEFYRENIEGKYEVEISSGC